MNKHSLYRTRWTQLGFTWFHLELLKLSLLWKIQKKTGQTKVITFKSFRFTFVLIVFSVVVPYWCNYKTEYKNIHTPTLTIYLYVNFILKLKTLKLEDPCTHLLNVFRKKKDHRDVNSGDDLRTHVLSMV